MPGTCEACVFGSGYHAKTVPMACARIAASSFQRRRIHTPSPGNTAYRGDRRMNRRGFFHRLFAGAIAMRTAAELPAARLRAGDTSSAGLAPCRFQKNRPHDHPAPAYAFPDD